MKCAAVNQISNSTSPEEYAVFSIPRADLSLLSLLSLQFIDPQFHKMMRVQYSEYEVFSSLWAE